MTPAHAVEPVRVEHVVVSLDGSRDAERAIPFAAHFASVLGADMTFVFVAASDGHGDDRQHQTAVEKAAAEAGAQLMIVPGNDTPRAILAAKGGTDWHVICLASHGRGRSAGLVGSVAVELSARSTEPVIVVGPRALNDGRPFGPVLACVDGTPSSEAVLGPAASWARAIGVPLTIVTVFEPAPDPVKPHAAEHSRYGSNGSADDYLGRLVTAWEGRGVTVEGTAIADPVSAVTGITAYADVRQPALIATTTHARTGWARLALGSVASGVVHQATAPVLLVPGPS